MSAAAGPFAIGAVLLVIGGAAKVWKPGDTARALRGVGLGLSGSAVRAGALVEFAIGVYALARGDRLSAVLVAGSYLAFAGFVTVALVKDAPIATCGCFGRADSPPSLVHVGCNLGLAASAVAVVADPGVGLRAVIDDQPLAGVPYLALVAVGVGLTFLALTSLPRTLALARESRM